MGTRADIKRFGVKVTARCGVAAAKGVPNINIFSGGIYLIRGVGRSGAGEEVIWGSPHVGRTEG